MKTHLKETIYFINHKIGYHELCALEMKYLFGNTTSTKHHITSSSIDLNRSIFIRKKIDILYSGTSIEDISVQMNQDQIRLDQYKVIFIKTNTLTYEERIHAIRVIGTSILGDFSLKSPSVTIGVTYLDGRYYVGTYQKNDNQWMNRIKKPFNYSHALDIKIAHAVVNIATANQSNITMIDPCCGIGTVVIEAYKMGFTMIASDINPLVVSHCNDNLSHFKIPIQAHVADITEIQDIYDVAILDLPYGQFSLTNKKEQATLMKEIRRISKRSIIITMIDQTEMILNSGFTIIDQCNVIKSNAFQRYIFVCQSI